MWKNRGFVRIRCYRGSFAYFRIFVRVWLECGQWSVFSFAPLSDRLVIFFFCMSILSLPWKKNIYSLHVYSSLNPFYLSIILRGRKGLKLTAKFIHTYLSLYRKAQNKQKTVWDILLGMAFLLNLCWSKSFIHNSSFNWLVHTYCFWKKYAFSLKRHFLLTYFLDRSKLLLRVSVFLIRQQGCYDLKRFLRNKVVFT